MREVGMPVRFRYTPSKPGIARAAVGPELRHAVDDVAHLAQAYAESISPAPGDFDDYLTKFEVRQELMFGYPDRYPMTRVSGVLINTSRAAILVEVGSAKVPEHGVLEKTLDWLERLGGNDR
jgi:hypothetical protein